MRALTQGTRKGHSGQTGRRTESLWRTFWRKQWNGRLADNVVSLKNNIDRLLLDPMEHVGGEVR